MPALNSDDSRGFRLLLRALAVSANTLRHGGRQGGLAAGLIDAVIERFSSACARRTPCRRVLGWLAEGKLRPHVDGVLPFERAGEALERLSRREVKGKLVLVP